MSQRLITLLILMTSTSAFAAGIGDRTGGIYGLLGLSRGFTTIKGESAKSDYSGWGLNGEAGADFVSASDFGLNVAGLFYQGDDKNRSSDTTTMETADSTKYGAKVGVIVSALTVGVGFLKTDFKARSVNTTNGSTETQLTGDEKFAYINLSFNIAAKYRSAVEIVYGQGSAGGLDTRTTTISLKIGIFEPLK